MNVLVCVWDPGHTLKRVQTQQAALADGTIAALRQEHGDGDAFRVALVQRRLVTVVENLRGESVCPECGTLMDHILADPVTGSDHQAALEDIVRDFSKAIARTRAARANG